MSKKNTKQNKKFRLNPLAVVALVVCALAVVYCATTAWLTGEPLNPIRFTTLEDFKYEMDVYFLQEDGSRVDVNAGSGAVSVDYKNPSAQNYISKLRVDVKQVGYGVAFSRVRVSHEWLDASGNRLQGDAYLPYTVNTAQFTDNRNTDGYIYYNGALAPSENYTSVINGFDAASFDPSAVSAMQGVTLSINVSVDAVQFNRYQQIWGMSSRPW
jgi:hypothetical protein